MTLKEAYELRRKEVLSLRRENAKLKEGTYTDAEKAAHEKEIQHLKHILQRTERERDCYHRLWQEALKRDAGYSAEFRIRIEDLENEKNRLLSENTSVLNKLQEALDTIAKLKAQMNRDHENSSIPSSRKPFHKKIKNSREQSGRKPGAQKGHPGHRRPHMEPTVPVIMIEPTPEMLSDPDLYPTEEFISKQKVDIHVSVSVTEYRAQIYRSRSTGNRVHAPFPDGVVNEFNYGENAKALAFLLNNYCNVSIDKTSELINGLTSGAVSLSKGLINSLPSQFSALTEKERKRIYSMLLLSPSMHADFTPGRVNGKCVQVIFCGNEDEVLYCFRKHKGHEGIQGTPVEEYQQTLIHDHDPTFYNYGGDHQECLSHILRYLQDAIENEPDLTWHRQMKDLLSSTIHEVKQDRDISAQRISQIESTYDQIVKTAQQEYLEHPPRKYFPDGYNLYKRMDHDKHYHLLFLRHPEIAYTNNLAERGLRKFKRKQKQAVTFRCNQSIEHLCDCMTVIETERLRGADIFQTALAAFSP